MLGAVGYRLSSALLLMT